jgi:ribonucleoside-diphosphate reductase alpha chain
MSDNQGRMEMRTVVSGESLVGSSPERVQERGNDRAAEKTRSAKTLKTTPVGGVAKKTSVKGEVRFERHFTSALAEQGKHPLDGVEYMKSNSKIKDTDGGTVFEMKDVEVPRAWSQLAVDILVSKYFRKAGVPGTGHETSVRQVIKRVAHTIRVAGEGMKYFAGDSAEIFEEELSFLLIHQMGAFNSPVWFNLGLYAEYGIEGSGGNYAWDPIAMRVTETKNAYQYPQCSACFIQSVDDDLMSIFQLVKNEARLFKYGSGTGTNFSKIRGEQEKLSGGGNSSGLMSFLEVFDKGAGATKSGGTTRRAAKMVCLDMDHPEIERFITWKSREEKKVAALIAAGYSSDFNGEAYKTVAGQNSNNSVRVSDEFMQAVEKGEKWETKARTDGSVVDTYEAKTLWKMIAQAAWACADPGVQYDTTINEWHTCIGTDRIRASNPCSEYMFLDDTACNLSSLNLVKFLNEDGSFDIEGYRRACRVFIVAQEILVDQSSYPTDRIAKNSHDYRPLGLGYANLGTLLMLKGIPYDSSAGRAWAGALTAIMCGHAYAVSAEEAGVMGPFPGYTKNSESMLKVIRKHREAAYKIDASKAPADLVSAARQDWDLALKLGEKYGYRNSQVTVLAPTGTIGLLMDCDTTGVEPDFALVKFKKLAGGGYFKIVNQSVTAALQNLHYTESQTKDILTYLLGTMHLNGTPHVNREFLKSKGLNDAVIAKIEKTLPGTFELSSAFTRLAIGEDNLKTAGVPAEDFAKPTFNFLTWSGITWAQLTEANEVICGTMTVEGAPHLKDEHLAVFDCANKCGAKGKRFIAPMGHILMMGATQPFLSGAISKTVNVPNETTVEEIQDIYYQGWKLGLKAVALYRDGCKLSQPLSAKSDKKEEKAEVQTSAKAEAKAEVINEAKVAPTVIAAAKGPVRRKLPSRRTGFTQEAGVAGHKVYIRTGEYEDGALGEVFIDMHKEGAAYRAMMNCFAISISLGLQYGVPLKEFVDKFTFTRFEPSGIVDGHPNVKMATSIVDYIFRVLGMEYLGRTDFVQVKPAVDLTAEKGAAKAVYPKDLAVILAKPAAATAEASEMQSGANVVSGHLAEMMGDAPPCDSCGHTTVRNGACYKCLNCGNSMGCS